jgi:hypothetical protein
LSQEWFANDFVLTPITVLAVGFLSELKLSTDLRRETKTYSQLVERVRTILKLAKQVFLGSGRLRFSFGEAGLLVKGGNLELRVGWDSVEMGMLVGKAGDVWTITEKPVEGATHLNVFLKPAVGADSLKSVQERNMPVSEFVVIPRSFFPAGPDRDCNTWDEFVTAFAKRATVV